MIEKIRKATVMDKEYLKNKIEGLRHHFVESTIHSVQWVFYDEAHMTKKRCSK